MYIWNINIQISSKQRLKLWKFLIRCSEMRINVWLSWFFILNVQYWKKWFYKQKISDFQYECVFWSWKGPHERKLMGASNAALFYLHHGFFCEGNCFNNIASVSINIFSGYRKNLCCSHCGSRRKTEKQKLRRS